MQICVNGPLIVKAMLEQGYGVRDICERARVCHNTIKKLMDGKMVRLDSVRRVMKELDLKADDLLDFDQEWKAHPPGLRMVRRS